MDAFMGTILAVGFNYAPRGWMFCNGQTVPIAQNSAMFALLGTMYGGDGQVTFGIPDLRGRVPVGSQGNGPGLTPVQQGEKAGTNSATVIANGTVNITVTSANLPAHTHGATLSLAGVTPNIEVSTGTLGGQAMTAGASLAQSGGGPGQANVFTTTPTTPLALGGATLSGNGTVTVEANTGGGQPLAAPVQTQAQISIMQPYLGLNYIIAMEGIFPSRN